MSHGQRVLAAAAAATVGSTGILSSASQVTLTCAMQDPGELNSSDVIINIDVTPYLDSDGEFADEAGFVDLWIVEMFRLSFLKFLTLRFDYVFFNFVSSFL